MKKSIYKIIVILSFIILSPPIMAGHIGAVKITTIREYNSDYALVYVTPNILNAPACATLTDRIALVTTGDQDYVKREFSMALTALTAGKTINPNCSNTGSSTDCVNIWSNQYVVKCNEMSISN